MFCSKCGRPLANGESCTCQQPQQVSPRNQGSRDATPALALLRKTLSSGMFLAIAILYSVAIICSLIMTVALPAEISDLTAEMKDVFGEGMYGISMQSAIDSLEVMEEVMNSMYPIILISSLIGMIPAVLIVIGLWKLYATAKSQNGEAMSTGGLSFIKVAVMIEFIAATVIYAIFIIAMVVLMVVMPSLAGEMFSDSYEAENFAVAMVMVLAICLVVFVAILAVMVLYYLKALKTIKVVKNTMVTGQPDDKVSIFLIVMMFIAATSVLSGLTTLFINPLSGISTLSAGAFNCIAAIALCIYRSKMKDLLYVPAQPMYQQAPQQQPMYQQPVYRQPIYQQPMQSYTITYTTCKECGQQYPSGSAVCPKCGTQNEKK